MTNIIISSPSLNSHQNVSGISSVVNFIISNNKKVNYVHFEIGKKNKERGGLFRILSLIKRYKYWKQLLSKNPDAAIHYNWPLSKASIIRDVFFMRYAIHNNRKILIHIHGGLFLTSNNIPFYLEKIMKYIFSWDVPFIVLSKLEQNILQTRFNVKNVIVLSNCVSLSEASSFERSLPQKKIHLGYLGRIESNKGMYELLEACKRINGKIPFVLHIAGMEDKIGRYIPKFQKSLGSSFSYEGVVSGKQKTALLKLIDVLVMPTYFEGLPMTLLECMSFGCIPVITPVGSIPSVCKDGENSRFIKVKNVDSVVEEITWIWENMSCFKEISRNAQNTISKSFNPNNYIEKLNSVYRCNFN